MDIWKMIKAKWSQSAFVVPERKPEAQQWLLHNIFFGFGGVWIPFLALCLFGHLRIKSTLCDGHLIMPVVTLSAVSMGFFMKETQINLRKTETLTYVGLMGTVIVGIIVMIALAFGTEFQGTAKLNIPVLAGVTLPVVVLAVILNFRLFMLSLEAVDREKVKQTLEEPIVRLTEEAKQGTSVDNVKL